MPCQKRLCKINQIRDDPVIGIGPVRSELEAVAGLFRRTFPAGRFFDTADPGRIAVILGVRPVADDEYLNIFVEAGRSPETIPLIAIDLVECFANSHAPAFQFRVDHRKAVHKDSHIVPIVMPAVVIYILVDDLQAVVMDAPAVNQA